MAGKYINYVFWYRLIQRSLKTQLMTFVHKENTTKQKGS